MIIDSSDFINIWSISFLLGLAAVLVKYFNFGFGILNCVSHQTPENPIKLKLKNSDKKLTLRGLVYESNIEEFFKDARSWMNPALFHGHLQTCFAGIRSFRTSDIMYFKRRIFKFSDGGSAAWDVAMSEEEFNSSKIGEMSQDGVELPKNTRMFTEEEEAELLKGSTENTKPIMIVLHGLSGSSSESYVRCILTKIQSEFTCVVLNSRGCGLAKLTSPNLFNGCWTEDLRETVDFLHDKFPNQPLFAIGFSLGGSILANYLGQEGDNCKLTQATVIGTPWDLCQSYNTMSKDFISNNIYSPIMTLPLKQLLKDHYEELSKNATFTKNWKNMDKIYRLADFDNYFTGPLFGFNCAAEYYRVGSAVNRIHNIRVPTLVINSKDDPIVGNGSCCLPYREVEINPFLFMILTNYGGHLGWFNPYNERWYAKPLSEFLLNYIKKFDLNEKPEVLDPENNLPRKHRMATGKLEGVFHN